MVRADHVQRASRRKLPRQVCQATSRSNPLEVPTSRTDPPFVHWVEVLSWIGLALCGSLGALDAAALVASELDGRCFVHCRRRTRWRPASAVADYQSPTVRPAAPPNV